MSISMASTKIKRNLWHTSSSTKVTSLRKVLTFCPSSVLMSTSRRSAEQSDWVTRTKLSTSPSRCPAGLEPSMKIFTLISPQTSPLWQLINGWRAIKSYLNWWDSDPEMFKKLTSLRLPSNSQPINRRLLSLNHMAWTLNQNQPSDIGISADLPPRFVTCFTTAGFNSKM